MSENLFLAFSSKTQKLKGVCLIFSHFCFDYAAMKLKSLNFREPIKKKFKIESIVDYFSYIVTFLAATQQL